MGLNISIAKYLLLVKQRFDVNYEKTAMLGRQYMYLSEAEYRGGALEKVFSYEDVKQVDGYAETMFQALGAKEIVSYDYSDYEGATYLHDMNVPISDMHKEKYNVVFDGGTLEHVLHYLIALHNAMEMVKIGGNLILTTPSNNYNGHGFYQFSPDLFFSILEGNGFTIEDISLANKTAETKYITHKLENVVCNGKRFWHQNINASGIGSLLYVCARKKGKVPNILTCYQANYEVTWKKKLEQKDIVWFRYYELERELECIMGLDENCQMYSKIRQDKIKILLYGAGKTCGCFMDRFKNKIDIVSIVDSDISKHGKKIDNIEIISPNMIEEIEADGIVVTTSDKWFYEIKNMLIEYLHIEEDRIYSIERFCYYMGECIYS